jgi:hypothetical protein
MSSFGTALVLDLPPGVECAEFDDLLRGRALVIYSTDAPDGWRRVCAYLEPPGLLDEALQALDGVQSGRLAVAEDFDEYGALWAVVRLDGENPTVVHRRWLLSADSRSPDEVTAALSEFDEDPRLKDVTSVDALTDAARLFKTDPSRMLSAEEDSVNAWQSMGVIGGPFPWWDALELPWPETGVGT